MKRYVMGITMCLILIFVTTGCGNRLSYDEHTIVLGVLSGGGQSIEEAVATYNHSHNDYQIVLKDYGSKDNAIDKMITDLMTGSTPDIIFLNTLPIEQYVEKGLLEDLTPYMEQDPDCSVEDLIPNVYDNMRINDGLYFTSPGFAVFTIGAGQSVVGNHSGYTITEFNDLLETQKNKDIQPFYSTYKGHLLSTLCCYNLGDYIDWNTGTCSFDGEEFRTILQLCNEWGENDLTDYEEEEPELVSSGRELFVLTEADLRNMEYNREMFQEEICYIGYPCADRQGNYMKFSTMLGMNTKSEKKDAAWSFLRMFMTQEFQKDNIFCDWPSRSDCYEQKLADAVADTPEYAQDVPILRQIIENTHKRDQTEDALMDEIIWNEAEKYFQGKKTLDETVAIIQKRCQTYVNEHR